ncbi:MAG: heavy-metal-associated domain-containing protein [Clostridium sp.]|jgi:copper chaperone CopZ|uniref:heavy-metal-associated domain-containing protein n=1 Tax=Clostridium sp. TaxID=1506 RepID=UPI0025BCC28E|nr:heavy-metal-associated domain-containing protein [Clostridium sp.]MCH3965376.1 heavy-metal-associated domain-containing protein [Clostridium sp.]MCI1714596.1 heavy-metal-associated domain-containing protein [Clostridium sp.]MCI1798858.1 heavy-metal-associated domain-containing protein [Clostridium sp.]MCI1812411.1 heavy-metal-associated domain-containing protein [Clostridium sp.]MCI1869669.1 heavy-metal-associated domain-containing protein [Clostridium sp.]
MKSIFKIPNMRTADDINNIRSAVANNQGVVACKINVEKGEVSIVYDDYFVSDSQLIQSIEDLGYAVF